jgi:hypothetical protein
MLSKLIFLIGFCVGHCWKSGFFHSNFFIAAITGPLPFYSSGAASDSFIAHVDLHKSNIVIQQERNAQIWCYTHCVTNMLLQIFSS